MSFAFSKRLRWSYGENTCKEACQPMPDWSMIYLAMSDQFHWKFGSSFKVACGIN